MTEMNLVLGAMLFGTAIDEDRSFAVLDAFVEAGGTWIDTADCYSFWADDSARGGASELLLGRWLAARPGVRDRVKLSTKVGAEPLEPGSFPERIEGLSATSIRRGMQRSLDRLGTDHVDMYWAHMEDRSVPLEETAATFGELIAEGLTRETGLSNHPTWRAERSRQVAIDLGLTPLSALQLNFSYLRRRPGAPVAGVVHPHGFATEETLDFAASNNMRLWAYTALMTGSYDRDDRPIAESHRHPGNDNKMAVLTEVAAELGVTRGQVVLAWLTGGTPSVMPILGGSTVEQLESAITGVRLEFPHELREKLDAAW